MRIGSFKFGNDYNFKPENVRMPMKEVQVRIGEKTKTIKVPDLDQMKGLNKIEIRYGVRKGKPGYEAMKSLYKLRSVFGYRLGGVIRQAYVKLSELTRHVANAINLHEASKETRAQKEERKNNPEWQKPKTIEIMLPNKDGIDELRTIEVKKEEDTGLDKYVRMYSTRDVLIALKNTNGGKMDSLKNLKYYKWDQIDDKYHKAAEQQDYSIRKLVVDGIINLKNIREDPKNFGEKAWNEALEHMSEVNKQGKIEFDKQKTDLIHGKDGGVGRLHGLRETGTIRSQQIIAETREKLVQLDKALDRLELDLGAYDEKRTSLNEIIDNAQKDIDILKNGTVEEVAERFSDRDRDFYALVKSEYVPREPLLSKETFMKAESMQRLDNAIGGLGRFVSGNSPIALVKRGASYFKCAIGLGGRKYDNMEKQKRLDIMGQGQEGKKYDKRRGEDGRIEATDQGRALWERLNNIDFNGKNKEMDVIPLDALNRNQGIEE